MRKRRVPTRLALLRTTALWQATAPIGPVVAALLALVVAPNPAEAQTFTWIGATSDYDTATNWNPNAGAPPNANTATAEFTNLGVNTVDLATPVTVDVMSFGAFALTPPASYTLNGAAITLSGANAQIFISGLDPSTNLATTVSHTINNAIIGTKATGTNQLVQFNTTDASTLTLGGVNTYTGNTSIDTGKLALVGNGSLANSFVSLGLTSVLDISGIAGGTTSIGGLAYGFNTTTPGLVAVNLGTKTLNIGGVGGLNGYNDLGSGVIAGSGGVNILGDTVFYNTQTYTGATTVSAGTLYLYNAQYYATTYGVVSSIASSSLVTVEAGANVYLNNVPFGGSPAFTSFSFQSLAGAGNVALGGNTLVLTNASSTFSGVIGLDILSPSVPSTGGLTIAGGQEILTGNNIYTGATTINTGARLQLGDGGTSGSVAGVIVDNGVMAVNRADTLTLTHTISGSGAFQQNGPGTTILTAVNTYSGPTTVNAGTLTVNGSIANSDVTVADGALIKGSGTLGGLALEGTLAPGNSIGTIHVTGNATTAAGSAYDVEIDAAGHSDRLAATGTVTLGGGQVVVLNAPGIYADGTTYTIITGAGGVAGTFDGVSDSLPLIDTALAYLPNSVLLTLSRNGQSIAGIGVTPNQKATGSGIDSLGGGVIETALSGLGKNDLLAALDLLSGEIHASAKSAFIEESRYLREAAADRIRSAFGTVAAKPLPVLGYADGGPAPAEADAPLAVWGEAFGARGSFEGDGNAAEFERSTGGFVTGIDALVSDHARVGVIGGYSHSSFDVDDRLSSGSADSAHLGAYGGVQLGNLGLRAGAAYSWHFIDTSRAMTFGGFADSLAADYHAATAQVFGEAGYRIDVGAIAFEPFANAAYVNLHTEGFTETGGAAALTHEASDTDQTFTTLGVRASAPVSFGGSDVTLSGMVGWRHAFSDVTPDATLSFAGGAPFLIAGTPIARDALALEAGLDLKIGPHSSLGIAYSGQIGDGAQDHSANAKLTINF